MGKLSDKQKQFCIEYLKDFNGTQSAIRAGYSKNTAKEQAYENFTKPHIKEYIKQLADELLEDDIQDILENRRFWKSMRENDEVGEMARLKASELIGRHRAMFTEKVQINAHIESDSIFQIVKKNADT